MAIIDDIKFAYRRGSMLMRFIFINIAVCVILHLATLVAWMITGDQVSWKLVLPSARVMLARVGMGAKAP